LHASIIASTATETQRTQTESHHDDLDRTHVSNQQSSNIAKSTLPATTVTNSNVHNSESFENHSKNISDNSSSVISNLHVIPRDNFSKLPIDGATSLPLAHPSSELDLTNSCATDDESSENFQEYLSRSTYKRRKKQKNKGLIPDDRNITFRRGNKPHNSANATYADRVSAQYASTNITVSRAASSVRSQQPSNNQANRVAPKFGTKKNTGVVVVKPKHSVIRCVFVSRFSPATTPTDVKNIILKSTNLHLNCRKLNVKFPELYSSFCINTTDDTQYHQLLNPDMWPDGILVMPFMGRARQRNTNPQSSPSMTGEQHQHSVRNNQQIQHVQQEADRNDVTLSIASVSANYQTSSAVNVELNTAGSNYESNVTEADSDNNDDTVLHVSNLGEEDTSIA